MATMRYGVDEEALMRKNIKRISLPGGVHLKSVLLDSDWEGDPAWRIILSVVKGSRSTATFVQELHKLANEVIDQVNVLNMERFAYVNFVAPEQP